MNKKNSNRIENIDSKANAQQTSHTNNSYFTYPLVTIRKTQATNQIRSDIRYADIGKRNQRDPTNLPNNHSNGYWPLR